MTNDADARGFFYSKSGRTGRFIGENELMKTRWFVALIGILVVILMVLMFDVEVTYIPYTTPTNTNMP